MKFRLHILAFLLLPLTVFAQTLTDSNLPILIINTDGGVAIPDEPKVLADMKIIWHQDGSRNYVSDQNTPEFLNYDGRIGIEIRGSSSQMLQKKPYGLETLQADNVTNNNVSILGMPKENDWIQQRINWLNNSIGSSSSCDDIDLPPLVISRIHYHPADTLGINGNLLEFVQINNNGDNNVDLSGIYLRELGITYSFPNGSHLAARDSLIICSDSLTFSNLHGITPFGEYLRKLSNKSENIVLADAWGNIIDEVHYADTLPWPTEADGRGAFLQLIDLDLDNSLPESWTAGYFHQNDTTNVVEFSELTQVLIYPNPAKDVVNVISDKEIKNYWCPIKLF